MVCLPRRCLLALALLCLTAVAGPGPGCGDGGGGQPGYADPCLTPMADVLGCPPRAGSAGATAPSSVQEACRRLVSCGILANSYIASTTEKCTTSADCDASRIGECTALADGTLSCHYQRLDLGWCAIRLTHPSKDLCRSDGKTYTDMQIDGAIQCITGAACEVLGLPFSEKLVPAGTRSTLDMYLCKDQKSWAWTATICDHGLLRYE